MQKTEHGIFYKLRNIFSERQSATENTTSEVQTESALIEDSENGAGFLDSGIEELDLTKRVVEEESVPDLIKEIKLRTVSVPPPRAQRPGENDYDIRFAEQFTLAGGKFIYCETIADAVEELRALKDSKGWHHVFCWENEIKEAFATNNFQKGAIGFTIENSDAAASMCESLIADDGNIVLNPKQASRRKLPCFPKTHIIFTDISHLAANRYEALERFNYYNKNELPSLINLKDNTPGQFYDQSRLILKAYGTSDIYVFLIDEIIPPSLTP